MNEITKYFEISAEHTLAQQYVAHMENFNAVKALGKEFMERHNIEANLFRAGNDSFSIVPAHDDKEKFKSQLTLKADQYGVQKFKKPSDVGKDWLKFLREKNFKVIYQPHVSFYFDTGFSCRYSSYVTPDGKLYLKFTSTGVNPMGPQSELIKEIKASEYHKIYEELEDKYKK